MAAFFKNNIFTVLLLLYTAVNCFSQDSAMAFKVKQYTLRAEKYLDKEKALQPMYSVNTNGISIYESPQTKLKGDNEFHISLDKIDDFKLLLKNLPAAQVFEIYKKGDYDKTALSLPPVKNVPSMADQIYSPGIKKLTGFKIALDAGHTAGDFEMGLVEKKCLKFKCDSVHGLKDSIAIAEGTLTFATAKLLKDKLETEGAEVIMTRPVNGITAFGVTFEDWMKTNYKTAVDSLYKAGKLTLKQKQFYLSSKANNRDKFGTIFKDSELEKRAEIINKYKPDFTIIIHYNVDETNTGWRKPADKNFNMTFVAGAFMRNDLSTPKKRFEFLRLLISDDLEKSIALSSAMVKSFEKNLNVKTASIKDAKYLISGCLPTDENGVYCRNLQLTRYILGPLVYGETLYQDNFSECVMLNKECDKTKNERVQQVAEAYFQGVLNYVKGK